MIEEKKKRKKKEVNEVESSVEKELTKNKEISEEEQNEYEVHVISHLLSSNKKLCSAIESLLIVKSMRDLVKAEVRVVKRKKDMFEYIVYITSNGETKVGYNNLYTLKDDRPKQAKINGILTTELLYLVNQLDSLEA